MADQPTQDGKKKLSKKKIWKKKLQKKKYAKKTSKKKKSKKKTSNSSSAKFPRHSVKKALRIPSAILEQNAGKACSPKEAASFLGVQAAGPFNVEVGSAIKYGFLERPEPGKIQPTLLAKQVLRPQKENDQLHGYREAILQAPEISQVYKHYRGENLPDDKFFNNTIVEAYSIPRDKVDEFRQLFLESLQDAELLTEHGEKFRVLDITDEEEEPAEKADRLRKLGRSVNISEGDRCFVMQPFAPPLGDYFEKIYKAA